VGMRENIKTREPGGKFRKGAKARHYISYEQTARNLINSIVQTTYSEADTQSTNKDTLRFIWSLELIATFTTDRFLSMSLARSKVHTRHPIK
jgi:hypothetical protein